MELFTDFKLCFVDECFYRLRREMLDMPAELFVVRLVEHVPEEKALEIEQGKPKAERRVVRNGDENPT